MQQVKKKDDWRKNDDVILKQGRNVAKPHRLVPAATEARLRTPRLPHDSV